MQEAGGSASQGSVPDLVVHVEVPVTIEAARGAVRQDLGPDVAVSLNATTDGTLVTIALRGLDDDDAVAFLASAAEHVGDWITDRRARRPSGDRARRTYGSPGVHEPMRRAVLDALELTADDHLLEIGCGGGLLLQDALRSGCRAAAVDHSQDMVSLARERNADAVAAGRLEVELAGAERLPFGDATFTKIAMVIVFIFLPDPVTVLGECHRVLKAGGRLAIYTIPPELKGHPGAAPEPMASRGRFYTDAELEALAMGAGFTDVSVSPGQLLVAHKR